MFAFLEKWARRPGGAPGVELAARGRRKGRGVACGMSANGSRSLYQPFLPEGEARAFVWKYSQTLGGRRPRHFHREPELNLVIHGSATFGVGNRVLRLGRGELLVFPAGQDHVLLEASADLYLFAMGLDPAFSADVLAKGAERVLPWHARLPDHELGVVASRASAIVDQYRAAQAGAELWQKVHWLARRAPVSSQAGPHVLTRRVLPLLSESSEAHLDQVAQEVRAHPSEISRQLHRDLGMTLVRYRMRLRLLNLIHLVDSAGHSLQAAADSAGFGSYSQCHRVFHAELGCAPRQFFAERRREMQAAYDFVT
jgi:AraC-like DNA-binding protein/quercetin dioxygenase-like cupin family protein